MDEENNSMPGEEAFPDLEHEDGKPYAGKRASKKPKKRKSKLQNVISWILTILAAFVAAMLINTYLLRTSMIYGESMAPTLHQSQVVILSKLPYIFGEPEFGEVVVFDSHCFDEGYEPSNFIDHIKDSLRYNVISQKLLGIHDTEERYWIKRVIGVPGDVIEFTDHQVYRNGQLLTEDYINQEESPHYNDYRNRYAQSSITVPEGFLFVMGDNRNNSKDSRMMGPVDMRAIVGKVLTGV